MHIAIVLGPFLPVPAVRGGAVEKTHLMLARAYRAAGHEVTIVSRRYDGFAAAETTEGVRHIRIPGADRRRGIVRNLFASLCYALRAAASAPVADVTITNELFLPLLIPRRRAGRIYVQLGRYPKFQVLFYFRADRLQAVSNAVAAAIMRQAPWLWRRVRVIGYAVDEAFFRRQAGSERGKAVLFVGRICKEKGIDLLIDAFGHLSRLVERQELDRWTLSVIGPHELSEGGDGADYLRGLKRRASSLGVRCEFSGPIFDQAALARQYQASAIFVYPSVANRGEALGLAPLEAMAAGCAAIVSDLRCFDDYVRHDETGLAFDHRAVDAAQRLADQLARLINEPERLQRIAASGFETACRFRTEIIAAHMLADFRSLLDTIPGRDALPAG